MRGERTVVEVEFAVVGLGGVGASVLYFLARSGYRVAGIDSFNPPHHFGASHGGFKVTREAVAEGAAYLGFVRRTNELLRDMERQHDADLLRRTGTLIIGRDDSSESSSFLRETFEIARTNNIEHEILSWKDLGTRYPQFVGLTRDEAAYFEPHGGFVRPEPLISLQLALARQAGAQIFTDCPLHRVSAARDGVELDAGKIVIKAKRVVIAAGKWAGELLGNPVDRLLTVSRQATFTFRSRGTSAYRLGKFPTVMWFRESARDECITVFPDVAASGGIKFFVADTELDPRVGFSNHRFYEHHVRPFFSGVSDELISAETCFYTSTPDHGFILDWHPEIQGLFIASACSGHGFKHCLGVGEAVAATVCESTSPDLSAFSLQRFDDNRITQ